MRTVVFYESESGHCPVEEFLDALAAKEAQKVAWVLQLIEELDLLPKQYFKKLVGTDDLWEVRVQISGKAIRLLGFIDKGYLVILNHAFEKKQQKAPLKEIKLAEKRRQEYLDRRKKK